MAIGRIPEPLAGIQEAILDAKGDLISATAADTPARLAVGSNNQILMADSAQSTGLKWAASATSTLTAKGDLLTATAANTIARLGVGADGTTLVADSSTSTGLKWAAAAAGGKVLQVVQDTTTTQENTGSASFVDTNLSQAITPSANTSKILAIAQVNLQVQKGNGSVDGEINIVRTATQIAQQSIAINASAAGNQSVRSTLTLVYLDNPATTSSTTYKVQIRTSNDIYLLGTNLSSLTLIEIGA